MEPAANQVFGAGREIQRLGFELLSVREVDGLNSRRRGTELQAPSAHFQAERGPDPNDVHENAEAVAYGACGGEQLMREWAVLEGLHVGGEEQCGLALGLTGLEIALPFFGVALLRRLQGFQTVFEIVEVAHASQG